MAKEAFVVSPGFRLTSQFRSAGRSHRFRHHVAEPTTAAECRALVLAAPHQLKLLPFGAGQSLGDSCLNDGGALIVTRGIKQVLSFDRTAGLIVCEPGLSMGELADLALSGPAEQRWFPAVFPGSTAITVGGAIANDVHGKNHVLEGSFCHRVQALTLLR